MKNVLDVHTHTIASGHAYNTIMEMAKAASEKGMELIGITEHEPAMPGTCHEFYFLNLKVLIRVIRSPEIIEVEIENGSKIKFTDVSIVAIILLIMVIFSLYLGVCFINSGDIGVYTNNPTYYDLFYYTIITFSTIGYGDICPISPVAKFMSMVISLTSFICLTIFVSSILSYKSEQ